MKNFLMLITIVLFTNLFTSCTIDLDEDREPTSTQQVIQATDSDWNGNDLDDDEDDDDEENVE